MALVQAYRRRDGVKVWIPEHWLGHPVLGGPFAKTSSQKARDKKKAEDQSSANEKE